MNEGQQQQQQQQGSSLSSVAQVAQTMTTAENVLRPHLFTACLPAWCVTGIREFL